MNFSLGLFQQGLIVTAFIAGLTALVSRIVFPLVQNKIKLFAPRQQANIILFVCFLPLLMVIYILAISYLPSLFHTWGFGPAHCGIDADPLVDMDKHSFLFDFYSQHFCFGGRFFTVIYFWSPYQ